MEIEQPQGKIYVDENGKAKLEWNPGFQKKWQGKIDNAQKFVDSECIRLMAKYTPFRAGILEKSATLGTRIGSGQIRQIAPYAKYQYYGKLMVSSTTGSAWSKGKKKVLTDVDLKYSESKHPLAGAFWFKRMVADYKDKILKGAQQMTDRG